MEFYFRLIFFAGNIKKQILVKVLIGVLIAATYVGQAFAMANGLSAVFKRSDWIYLSTMILISLVCITIRAFLMHKNEVYSKEIACTGLLSLSFSRSTPSPPSLNSALWPETLA